jgi:hypothetical protein
MESAMKCRNFKNEPRIFSQIKAFARFPEQNARIRRKCPLMIAGAKDAAGRQKAPA